VNQGELPTLTSRINLGRVQLVGRALQNSDLGMIRIPQLCTGEKVDSSSAIKILFPVAKRGPLFNVAPQRYISTFLQKHLIVLSIQ
jgi:hypothetical protein